MPCRFGKAAQDVSAVLTLTTPRIDDPLAGVVVPVAATQNPDADKPSHLQQVQAELVSKLPVPDAKGGVHHTMPPLKTNAEYSNYIRTRTAAWKAAKNAPAVPVRP
jgi:phospholipase C